MEQQNEFSQFELVILVDGLPTFSPMAKLIKSFSDIIKRDKGGKIKGDHEGRKKLMSTLELAYIWYVTDRKSPIRRNYPENEWEYKAKEKLGMPEEWKPDKLVEEACLDWFEITATQTSKVLEELRSSLFSSQRIIGLLRKRLDKRMDSMALIEELSGTHVTTDDDTGVDPIKEALEDVKKLIELSNKIPETISVIEKLEEKVAKETSDGKGKGGKDISRRQFPKDKR